MMGDHPASLAAWREAVKRLERTCPWPGPRPFDEADAGLLVGRDEDRARFLREVDSHRLILLTGPSGVGKTSLLNAGLVPQLRAAQYIVAVCREWGRAQDEDVATFLSKLVHAALPPDERAGLPCGAELLWALEDRFGGRAVLILDQFEELIRDDPTRTAELYDLLLDVNRQTRIRVVISFRDEYLMQLRPIENGANPYTFSRHVLAEVDPSFALDLILSGNRDREVIDPAAAALLAREWRDATTARPREQGVDPFRKVGLLHLQAALYALHESAGDRLIDVDAIESFRSAAGPVDLFLRGLMRSIDVKLQRCIEAGRAAGLDEYVLIGAMRALALSVRHLSSAGYKLVREASELGEKALSDEIESLRGAMQSSDERLGDWNDRFRALLYTLLEAILPEQPDANVFDLLTTPGRGVAAATDARLSSPPSAGSWVASLDSDDLSGVTCGPMSGCAPAAVLLEEMRRFAFALAWLRETSLVRLSRPARGGLMVSLIHDGFGEALQRWSAGPLTGPTGAIHAMTAPRGASFKWRQDGDAGWLPELAGGQVPRVLSNLRWRGAWVCAAFRRVVFVNCDFRGTFFDRTSFEGVAFVNCLLDGVMFSDCEVLGTFRPATGPAGEIASRFAVDAAPAETLAVIAHYRGVELPSDEELVLIADLAGGAAVPAPESAASSAIPWVAEEGGMVICGGRVSSLVLRACRGDVSLRHVAGSGIDVVERSSGRYEIFGSVLRHLAFTRHADSAEEAQLHVSARSSVLAQMWFGDAVHGTFCADDCTLMHVWNGSRVLEATAAGGRYHGLVGIEAAPSSTPLDGQGSAHALAAIDPDDAFAVRARTMDYRRTRLAATPWRS